MSNKKEIYYKFIFPTYENLSGSDNDSFPTIDGSASNPFPTCDGKDQLGEVRALCRECPERVITYDKLDSTLKSYVNAWVSIPKYFNLRNYWDANPCQEGGMSLIVSHTPENLGNPWTKFKVGTKTIYCSLVISSGDFFYGFTLPDEVIEKSGLRDTIVTERFHENWYITDNDIDLYRTIPRAVIFNNTDALNAYPTDADGYPYTNLLNCTDSYVNPLEKSEKRVFIQHYFNDCFLYGRHSTVDEDGNSSPVRDYSFIKEDLKKDFIDLEATRRILYYYDGTRLRNPNNALIEIVSTDNIPILLDPNLNPTRPATVPGGNFWWRDSPGPTIDSNNNPIPDDDQYKHEFRIKVYDDTTSSWKTKRVYTKKEYYDKARASLRDWSRKITKTLSKNIDKLGTNTRISYEPPDVYRTDKGGCPPLQIPYNLLRYCLNDRPPFSDCETVLVMWVADSDPLAKKSDGVTDVISDGNVAALHALDWQQYAIPISVRCCFKENDTCNTDRFLVTYPYGKTSIAKKDYALHFRRTAKYDVSSFKEALFLQDLIRYSNDYIISYRNTSYTTSVDTQMHLFENEGIECRALYVRKEYVDSADNRENQTYYVKVDESLYDVNDIKQFTPNKVGKEDYEKWDLDGNDWAINNNWIIALFDKSGFDETPSGTLALVNSKDEDLREKLNDIAPPPEDAKWSWDDIYISSLGISPCNQTNGDFMKLTGSTRGSTTMLPLDVLDGHIKIDNIIYGSKFTNTSEHRKAIVLSFKDMFDYKYEGLYHFRYYENSHSYQSVISTYNSSTGNYDFTKSDVTCTAYVEYL